MKFGTILLAGMIAFGGLPALAQGTGAINVLGTVDKLDGTTMVLRSDDGGAAESFRLAADVLVLQSRPATLADIRPNDFVASAARPGADGKLHSVELRIFPEALRGAGEGQRPMAGTGNLTMTNATVTGAAVADGSNDIKVSFKGGVSEMVVDPGVPVTRIDVADKSLLKVGAKVRVQGARDAGGASASRITIQ
jgi:hypothetical protein